MSNLRWGPMIVATSHSTYEIRLTEGRFHRFGGHSIRRLLQSWKNVERQRDDIRKIGKQVKRDDCATANQEGPRQVASRLFYFTAGECDIVPCRLGEQWADHCEPYKHQQP